MKFNPEDLDFERIKSAYNGLSYVPEKRDSEWRQINGSIAQHLRFHPYAEVAEVEKVPGLTLK